LNHESNEAVTFGKNYIKGRRVVNEHPPVDVNQAKIVRLLGQNGAGKTFLLYDCCLIQPNEGKNLFGK